MKIGEAHRTQPSYLHSANTIGAPLHSAPIGVADQTRRGQGTSERQYIGAGGPRCAAPMSPTQNFFFRVRSATPIGAGCIGAPIYWRNIRKMIVFGAPCLFSYQSPIN